MTLRSKELMRNGNSGAERQIVEGGAGNFGLSNGTQVKASKKKFDKKKARKGIEHGLRLR